MTEEGKNILDTAINKLKKAIKSKEEINKSHDEEEQAPEVKQQTEDTVQKSIAENYEKVSGEMSEQFDIVKKSLADLADKNQLLADSMVSALSAFKSLSVQLDELKAKQDTLSKSIDDVLNQPLGRKSVVSQREVQTLRKSTNEPLSSAQVDEILLKAYENKEIDANVILQYNAGNVPLEQLNLPESVKQRLGI